VAKKVKKPNVKIENWIIVQSPAEGHLICLGRVVDHPRLGSQDEICTSELVRADFEAKTIETQNTIYSLGQPLNVIEVMLKRAFAEEPLPSRDKFQ
jgi:hypothetical protein